MHHFFHIECRRDKWIKLTDGWKLNPDKLKLEMKHIFKSEGDQIYKK